MKNTVTRVSAPDTTEGTKRRNAEIAAEAAAREKAEIEYYRSMMDPNNQSAEAMAFRDGPIQSLTPDVIEMIALGKPTEWALKAAGKYVVKPAMKKSGGVVKKMIDDSLDFGGRTVDSVGNMSTIVNWTKRHASGKAKADLKAIFGKQAEEDLAKNGLHLQRQLPVTSLKKDLADGHATAPSIEIVGSRSASGVQSGGYGGGNTSGNFSDAPVVIHYKRSAFNVDPENLDIAKATDIWSPSSFRVKELREQGMSWADIVKSWKQHPDGSKYALDIDVTPEGKVITVPVTPDSRIKFGVGGGVERRLGDLPTKIIQDQYRPGYRTGDSPDHLGIPLRVAKDNRFGSEFDVVRDPRFAVSGELKPFREVPNDQAIDFVEIPRSWTVKGKRMYSTKERYELQRELEKAGIKYRVYDEGSFTPEDLSLHYPGAPKASVKWLGVKDKISDKWDYGKMKPELFREDAKGGQSADVRAATKGGDGGNETAQVEAPVQESAAQVSDGGPRIVINPSTFHNEKDALCVAYNEALRIVMEENGFDPVSEPTDAQREFFADTAYADDELMLRRTILARICVFDTSVKDPTDEQLEEAVEFLETVMEIGAPQNSEEQSVIQRAHDVIAGTLQGSRQGQGAQGAGSPQGRTEEPREPGNPSASTGEPQSETRPPEPPSEEPLSEPPM